MALKAAKFFSSPNYYQGVQNSLSEDCNRDKINLSIIYYSKIMKYFLITLYFKMLYIQEKHILGFANDWKCQQNKRIQLPAKVLRRQGLKFPIEAKFSKHKVCFKKLRIPYTALSIRPSKILYKCVNNANNKVIYHFE